MKNQSATVNLDLRMLELRQEIWDTAQELRHAYDRFDFVTDPALIEAGIYDINALKSRYDFLLRKLKATIDDAMDAAGLPLLGVVPEDPRVMLSANLGQPLTPSGRAGAADACVNIARRLEGQRVPIMRIR